MPRTIIVSSYLEGDSAIPNPLCFGCGGGAGHNEAMKSIVAYLKARYQGRINFVKHKPVLATEKHNTFHGVMMRQAIHVMHNPIAGSALRYVLHYTPFPILPNAKQIDEEIQELTTKQIKQVECEYVDMLFDVMDDGHEKGATWNLTQREDKVADLKKMVELQGLSDSKTYDTVYDYVLKKLQAAARAGNPYTEIISPQAMALAAICDAVIAYNKWIDTQYRNYPKVLIHQYMTDLPTTGAVHFFNALSALKREQQETMNLYAVGLNAETLNYFFKEGEHFSALCNVSALDNPMVREGFKNRALDNSLKFKESVRLKLADNDRELTYDIQPNEKIASIMLGSQAGNDTFKYIQTLLDNGMQKVFVFGGKTNPELHTKINALLQDKRYEGRIVPLAHQSDLNMAPLMTRSNVLVIRGGGLSVMEQLAMAHNPEQMLFFHHPDDSEEELLLDEDELTCGISWENENINHIIMALRERGLYCKKTSPKRLERHLLEGQFKAIISQETGTLSIESLRYLRFLHEKNNGSVEQFGNLEQWVAEQLVPLDNLLSALFGQRKQLQTQRTPLLDIRVYEHKLAVIEQAIQSLQALMFCEMPAFQGNNAAFKRNLIKSMNSHYLFVHKSGEGLSTTENLINAVIEKLNQASNGQNLAQESKEEPLKGNSVFQEKSFLIVQDEDRAALLVEIEALRMEEGRVDVRLRAKKQMLEMARKYLQAPSLAKFNELTRLKLIYNDLNRCALVLNESCLVVDKILELPRQALKLKGHYSKVKPENEDLSELEETEEETSSDELEVVENATALN